jgi:tetratricopeptide (TPR) repeat protein
MNPDLHAGLDAEASGNLHEAERRYREAVRADPRNAEARYALGNAQMRLGQFDAAQASYEAAAALRPEHPETRNNLAVALAEQGRLEDAVAAYGRALEARVDYAEAHYNLGNALFALRRHEDAAEHYERAVALRPDWPEASSNLGMALAALGRTDAAIAAYHRALALRPDYPEALNGLALVRQSRGEFAEAMRLFDRALGLRPDFVQAHANRAQLRLQQGDFARGWPEYEWRWKLPGMALPRAYVPRWDGSPLAGRTILLRNEQGLGDTIQFVRYAPVLAAQGGRVIVECQSVLLPLLRSCPGIHMVVARGTALPAADVQAPLLSLPGMLGATAENAPASVPYLFADPAIADRWREEIGPPDALRIGIAWQGNSVFPQDCHRRIPLAAFAPVARVPGVRLISLQRGFGREQLADASGRRLDIIDLGGRLEAAGGGFLDAAAAMLRLDLVVTVDSAVAHLAGALGVPVWVALTVSPDFRWLLGREDTPWYPTMRLFRQRELDRWDEVFDRIAAAVRGYVPVRASASGAGRPVRQEKR